MGFGKDSLNSNRFGISAHIIRNNREGKVGVATNEKKQRIQFCVSRVEIKVQQSFGGQYFVIILRINNLCLTKSINIPEPREVMV